jgi:hypothetical protein
MQKPHEYNAAVKAWFLATAGIPSQFTGGANDKQLTDAFREHIKTCPITWDIQPDLGTIEVWVGTFAEKARYRAVTATVTCACKDYRWQDLSVCKDKLAIGDIIRAVVLHEARS